LVENVMLCRPSDVDQANGWPCDREGISGAAAGEGQGRCAINEEIGGIDPDHWLAEGDADFGDVRNNRARGRIP